MWRTPWHKFGFGKRVKTVTIDKKGNSIIFLALCNAIPTPWEGGWSHPNVVYPAGDGDAGLPGPRFVGQIENVTVAAGRDAVLTCTVEHLRGYKRRALRLVGIEEDQQSCPGVTSLEHRRDVSALVVCHKAQVQEVPQLSSLRLPPRAVQRWSRTTPSGDVLVNVPRSHSRQHQRTYILSQDIAAVEDVHTPSENSSHSQQEYMDLSMPVKGENLSP
ncbi:hypothetical protein GWK47_014461 [Chionoecetes opilio]|uniref:Uncharacterized protein n=1 Tax=Chionoecetes opilio TaxID=41210 RepID=A0A8J5CKI5_CHIOP|nr:hypothetical protein GWK47_014461 [Chionoecetes opilio]